MIAPATSTEAKDIALLKSLAAAHLAHGSLVAAAALADLACVVAPDDAETLTLTAEIATRYAGTVGLHKA
jgi:Flp pilus assembly protein TadD